MYSADSPLVSLEGALLAPTAVIQLAAEVETAGSDSVVDAQVLPRSREIVFVDAGIDESAALIADIERQASGGRSIEVHELAANGDGLAQIQAVLEGRHDVDALHLISHGSQGVFRLGATTLDMDALLKGASRIKAWGEALGNQADILIYGCDVAGNEQGRSLMAAIARLTGADVAMSDDRTGYAAAGGDWVLEARTGEIDANVVASGHLQQSWQTVLATYTVTNTSDSGAGSLRDAITSANASGGADVIEFSIAGAGPHTISVLTVLPTISESVLIDGWSEPDYSATNPVPMIEINGNATSGVDGLRISGSNVTVRGLTINRFDNAAIHLESTASGAVIQGNFLGTNNTGTGLAEAAGGMSDGMQIRSTGNTIGGDTLQERNIIAGTQDGIRLTTATALGNDILGNWIGTDITGTQNLGVTDDGIDIGNSSSGNTIGGVAPGEGNLITNSAGRGIEVRADAGGNNGVAGNLIYGNTGMGIDFLGGSIAAPTLSTATSTGATTTITGTLAGAAGTVYRIDFFATPSAFVHLNGGGARMFLGSTDVTTDGAGNVSFNVPLATAVNHGDLVTATATNPSGTTSEFAVNLAVTGDLTQIVVDTSTDVLDGTVTSLSALLGSRGGDGLISLREAILAANATGGTNTIRFNIPGTGTHSIQLASALPAIDDPVIIDGSSEPDYTGAPVIELDGSVTTTANGLVLDTGSGGSTIRGLVINRFDLAGIRVNTDGNTIAGNYLGTSAAGTADQGNGHSGVLIYGSNNTIGGSTAADRNVISGNDGYGVVTDTGAAGGNSNIITGNYIGLDVNGSAAVANGFNGLFIAGNANRIGGTTSGEGNVIGGHSDIGVRIDGATGTVVKGNRIGTNAAGTAALANAIGIRVAFGATGTVIGGTTTDERNLISGNTNSGILLDDSSGAVIIGNYIGIDAAGTADLGNGGSGIQIDDAASNTIGGDAANERNVISGNALAGVAISGTGSTNNTLQGNYIGTNWTGLLALGNTGSGVTLSGAASGNLIGGASAGEGNTISANGYAGILVSNDGTDGNVIRGNYIGTDKDGVGDLGNASVGISLFDGPANTLIGGDRSTPARNVIAFNNDAGIYISGVATVGNWVRGNFIGVLADGTTAAGNTYSGVELLGGTTENAIGGDSAENGNVIAHNGTEGIRVSGAATTGNSFLRNSIFANGIVLGTDYYLGINLGATSDTGVGVTANDLDDSSPIVHDADSGPNDLQNFPVLTSVSTSGGVTSIKGTLKSAASSTYRIEFFSSPSADGTGYGEGQTFLGVVFVTTDASGTGTISTNLGVATTAGHVVTATATYLTGGTTPYSTSEFSAAMTITTTAVPVVTLASIAVDFTEGGPVGIDVDASITDGDSANLTGATVRISANHSAAQDELVFTDMLGITGSWNAGTGTLTLSGTTTVANYQTALRSIAYTNSSDTPTTATRTVEVIVSDGVNSSVAATRHITVTAANDPPVITPPANQYTALNTAKVFSTAGGTAITISDADAGGGAVQVTLSVSHGALTLAQTTGLSFTSGDGTGDAAMVFIGTVSDVNAALEGLTYSPTTGYRGLDQIEISVNDQGNSGGAAQTDSAQIDVHVGALVVTTDQDNNTGTTTSIAALIAADGSDGISLREAITAANNTTNVGGPDRIYFDIAGSTPHTIHLTSSLDSIDDALIIDGSTDPDFVSTPMIVLDGSLAGASVDGLTLVAGSDGSTIRGLVIQDFSANGIWVTGTNGNTIAGNYVGIAADGSTAAGNANGIMLEDADVNTIGGVAAGDRNVIAGSLTYHGLWLDNGADNNTILGNYIGTSAGGSADRGNAQDGIYIRISLGNQIGNGAVSGRNLISGNDNNAITVEGAASTGNRVQGNFIGWDVNGTGALGNGQSGVYIHSGASGNLIGGATAGEGNAIGNGGGKGVTISGAATTENSILRNTITAHAQLGIDLGNDGLTANDGDDVDVGANALQNFPVLLTAGVTGTTIQITGQINATPSKTFRLEFFNNALGTEDASGYGEGRVYLGTVDVNTDALGDGSFTATLTGVSVAAGDRISATATLDEGGGDYRSTSEFSLNLPATTGNTAPSADAGGPYASVEGGSVSLSASGSSDVDADTLTYAWDLDNDGNYGEAGEATTVSPTVSWATLQSFGIDDDGVYTIGVRVSDGNGGIATDTATLTVANVAPTLTLSGSASVVNAQLYTLTLSSTDPGADTISGWTINWGDGNVQSVAGSPGSVTHTYSGAGRTYGILAMAQDEDGAWSNNDVLVSSLDDDVVYRFNIDSGVVMGTLAANASLDGPAGNTIGPDGRLYVAGNNSNNVIWYDIDAGTTGVFVTAGLGGLSTPNDVAFGPDGYLYVASYGSNQVLRYDGTSGLFIDAWISGTLNAPSALAFGPDGNLYVGDWFGGNVYKFDGDTGALMGGGAFITGGGGIVAMGFGPDGNLYVGPRGSSTLTEYNGSTGALIGTVGTGFNPYDVTIGPDGLIYSPDLAVTSHINTFDTTLGASAGQFDNGAHSLSLAWGLAFLPDLQVTVTSSLPPSIAGLAGDALSYSEGDGAVVIEQFLDITVSDADSANFDTGTLTVAFVAGSDASEDALSVRHQGSAFGQIGVSGSTISYSGTPIGTFTGGSGGTDLVFTFNAGATPAVLNSLLMNITYRNTDTVAPTPGARTVRFTLTDGDGGSSANYDATVTVSGIDDAAASSGGAVTGTEDTSMVLTWANFNITDGDSAIGNHTAIQIRSRPVDGTLQVSNGFSWEPVTVNQTITKATIDAGWLRFVPDAHESGHDAYGAPGVGHLLNDYARFDFAPVQTIAITNPDAELGGTQAEGTGVNTATGWTLSGTVYTSNHTDTNFPGDHDQNFAISFGSSMSQILGSTFDADLDYALSVDMGWHPAWSSPLFRLELWAGGTRLGFVDESAITPVSGAFVRATLSVTGSGFIAQDGQLLEVRVLNTSPISNTASFDNFMLTTMPAGTGADATMTIDIAPANDSPSADAGGPYTIAEGASVVLNASASSDIDGDALSYAWDLDNDGNYGEVGEPTTVGPTVTWTTLQSFGIDDDGVYTIGVRVSDGNGGLTTNTSTLTVTNVAPTLTTSGAASAVMGVNYTLTLGAVDPGADTITGWTINWGDGSISTVGGNPGSVTHAYAQSGFTYHITAAATDEDGTFHQGDLLVPAWSAPDAVFRFAATTGAYVGQFASGGGLNDHTQIITGPDGNYYVSGLASSNVLRYAPNGTFLSTFVSAGSGGLSAATGMTFGPDGNLYVVDYGLNAVLRYNGSSGAYIDAFVSAGSGGLNDPLGIAFGPDGNLYVSSRTPNGVLRYDGSTGAFIDAFVAVGPNAPVGAEAITFGPDGNLYVASNFEDKVRRFNGTTGAYIDDFVGTGSGGLSGPAGIAFGPDGEFYVTSQNSNQVLRYDGSTGVFIDTYVSAGSGGLAVPVYFMFEPGHSVSVTATNNAPVNTVPGAQTVNEDTPLTIGGISVNDGDGNLGSVQLTVTNGILSVTLQTGASISAGASGSATLTLAGTQAAINATLATLSYQGNAHYAGADTLTITSVDSAAASDVDTVAITVSPVNDSPTLDLDANNSSGSVGTAFNASFTEGGSPVLVVDTDALLTDVDSANLSALYIDITNLIDGSANELLTAVTTGTSITATYQSWGSLELTGVDSVANYQQVLRTVRYQNLSENPNPTTRTLNVSAFDGFLSSNTAVASITITPVNDEQIVAINTGATVAEGSTGTVIGSTLLSTADADNPAAQRVYTLTSAPSNGTLRLGAGALGIGGTFTQADINGGLVTYDHNGSETSSDSFGFSVDDGAGAASTGTFAITVTAVNDQSPVITSSGTASVAENTTAVLTVTATDADVPANTLAYSILAGGDGALFSIAPGTGVLSFSAAPDFEAPADGGGDNIYDLSVQVSDGLNTTTQAITVNVTAAPTTGTGGGGDVLVPIVTDPPDVDDPEAGTDLSADPEVSPDAGVDGATDGRDAQAGEGSQGEEAALSGALAQYLAAEQFQAITLEQDGVLRAGRIQTETSGAQIRVSNAMRLDARPSNNADASGVLLWRWDQVIRQGLYLGQSNKTAPATEMQLLDMPYKQEETLALEIILSPSLWGGLVAGFGTAWWAGRAGVLLGSVLAGTPAWARLDPLPIAYSGKDDPLDDDFANADHMSGQGRGHFPAPTSP